MWRRRLAPRMIATTRVKNAPAIGTIAARWMLGHCCGDLGLRLRRQLHIGF
jgi:hypothetical protein